MRLIRHCNELTPEHRGSVVALGNFDGVHLGHQVVIQTARRIALAHDRPHAVMSFEPHPRAFFNPALPPFRLTPLRVKARLIEALGINVLLMQHFDQAFATQTAETFVEEVLVRCFGVFHVVVGYDYVFGKGRQGTCAFLQRAGTANNFGVTVVPPALDASGEAYSSTRVRDCLVGGQPAEAARLLGHYWEVEGRVEKGDGRGRTIGFPTANIALADYQRPATGVYAIRAGIDAGGATRWHNGVANFGRRPTIGGESELLEVHLFDLAEDLYGRHLRVALIDYLRPERKFAGLDELKAQIALDALEARRLLDARHFPVDPGPLVPVAEAPR